MAPGTPVRWYSDHGWRFGRIASIGHTYARVTRCGKVSRVHIEKLIATTNKTGKS